MLQTPLKPTAVIFQVLPLASMNFHSGTLEVKANSALVITLVLENLNVTDGAKKFLLKRPKSKQIDDRSTIAKRKFSS